MVFPSTLVFQKTERGREEIARRSRGLTVPLRWLLITLNGHSDLASYASSGLKVTEQDLTTLVDMGLIELVPAARPIANAVQPTSLPSTAVPAATVPASVDQAPPITDVELTALRRLALQRLQAHFGLDTKVVVADLFKASSANAYRQALKVIEGKLAIYLGRKGAAQTLEGLWPK